MSVSTQGNVIRIPIEIALEDKQEWQQMIQELENAKVGIPDEHKPQTESPAFPGIKNESEHDPAEKDSEGKPKPETTDPNELGPDTPVTKKQVTSIVQAIMTAGGNPLGFSEAQLAKFIPYIGELLLAAGFAEELINIAYEPGGPLDIRWKRDIPTEVFNLFDRQTQQNLRVGLIQVIGTAVGGFRSLNGANVENTFREIATNGRVSKIGLQDKANGWNGL